MVNITNLHEHKNGWSVFKWCYTTKAGRDIDKGALTDDINTNPLDLSALVPADTILAMASVFIQDDAVGSAVKFTHPKVQGAYNHTRIFTQVANVYNEAIMLLPVLNQVTYINCNPKPSDWTVLGITIIGWWLK